MTPTEHVWRSWVMGTPHTLSRRRGRAVPFGRCLFDAWARAREIRADEERRRAA